MKIASIIISFIVIATSHPICAMNNGDVNKDKNYPSKNYPELPTTQNEITCEYDNGYLVISFEHESGRTHLSLSKVSDNSIINEIEISSTCQFVHYIGQIDEPIMVNITTATSSHSEIIY